MSTASDGDNAEPVLARDVEDAGVLAAACSGAFFSDAVGNGVGPDVSTGDLVSCKTGGTSASSSLLAGILLLEECACGRLSVCIIGSCDSWLKFCSESK